jgi:hypothetical protein
MRRCHMKGGYLGIITYSCLGECVVRSDLTKPATGPRLQNTLYDHGLPAPCGYYRSMHCSKHLPTTPNERRRARYHLPRTEGLRQREQSVRDGCRWLQGCNPLTSGNSKLWESDYERSYSAL